MSRVESLLKTDPRVRVASGSETDPNGRAVVYWMQRAQRGRENPALDTAIELGDSLGLPVLAVFGLTADYPGAQRRHYRFLVDALPEVAGETRARGVPLVVRLGPPDEVALALAAEARAAVVVGDENPLRVGRLWRDRFARSARVPFVCVDADVVVPTALFPKEEYAARTIRPKIHKVLSTYLKASPNRVAKHEWPAESVPRGEPIEPDSLLDRLKVGGVPEVPGYRGGPNEAKRRLERFVRERLPRYAESRNEPIPYTTSEISAHLHFGHLSPVTAALAARESGSAPEAVDVFLEELIVRRELAVNFVARNPDYDTLAGCPSWARDTLARHRKDPRPVLYDDDTLESGLTHDPLWNAAQHEMAATGRMHNYLRMYWAKRVLEWTPDAETAFRILVDLNDRYEMDGRDPSGYTGVAWAVGGKHDRPWPERPIFGTVRTMTYEGAKRKFDTERYIAYVRSVSGR